MVTAILIRHGMRDRDADDPVSPLTAEGVAQAQALGVSLASHGFAPQVFLSSAWPHAMQTANAVRERAGAPGAGTIAVAPLTPHQKPEPSLPAIEAEAAGTIALSTLACFACVGHEPRLGQLAELLTGEKFKNLGFAEALCITAASYAELLQGHGQGTKISGSSHAE